MNIICKVLGHDEVWLLEDGVSICNRCDATLTAQGANCDPIDSWNLGWLVYRRKFRIKRWWDGLKWRLLADKNEIPF